MNHRKKKRALQELTKCSFVVTCRGGTPWQKKEAYMIMAAKKREGREYPPRVIQRSFVLVVLAWLTYSCARIMAPEGGPKDTVPPRLVHTIPAQGSTGFRGKVITLVFDKDIEVHDIYNKLVVTPRLPKLGDRPGYTCNVRGKKLKLILGAPLEEETTYTFNFNGAIKDITEGNITEGLVLTFCTGNHIDKRYVTGQVKHLMTQKHAAKVLVALCKADKTTPNIFNNPPDYFTKTDEEGKFSIEHVKEGKYYIHASTSKESQLTVSPSADEYGFLKDAIDLTTAPLENVTISILKADARILRLNSQQPQGPYFELRFSKPVVCYTLALVNPSKRPEKLPMLYSHLVEGNQVIRVYNTFGLLERDNLEAHLTAKDELGTVIEEKVNIQFEKSSSKEPSAAYTLEPATGTKISPDFVGKITVNKPVKEIATDRLFFVVKNSKKICLNAEDLELNAQRNVITITKQLVPSMSPSEKRNKEEMLILQMDEGAFVTVEGDSNRAVQYVYTFRDPKQYGTIQGTITTEAPNFIVQLLDSEYNVIDSLRNECDYQFNGIAPGSYKLRLLIPRGKGDEWCSGNIHERREPDPVVLYPADVAVIANWEIKGIDFCF